jgi:hypothetical protein
MMTAKNVFMAGCALGAIVVADIAVAQTQSLFTRDRNTSVLQRERSEYDPLGIRAGSFIVKPRLDLGIAYSDNVLGIDRNINPTFDKRDDTYFVLRPSVGFESNWNRHSVRGGAYVEGYQHLDLDDENIVNAGVNLDNRVDVTRNTALIFGGSYDLLHESRQVGNGVDLADISREPIEYDRAEIYGGIEQEFGRIRYRGRLGYRTFDFDDAESAITGNVIEQDFRDVDEASVLLQAGFAMTRDSSLFIRGTYRTREYDNSAFGGLTTRDSEGYTIAAGVDFDITRLARGTVAVGYLEEDFDDPTLAKIDGFSLDAGLEWFPSELTTVTLTAARDVRASPLVNAASFTANEVSLRIDQELARNLIASASIGYGLDDYENTGREDERYAATVGATYLINRLLSASLEYRHIDQDSDVTDPLTQGLARDFTANEVLLTLTAHR